MGNDLQPQGGGRVHPPPIWNGKMDGRNIEVAFVMRLKTKKKHNIYCRGTVRVRVVEVGL